MIDMKERVPFIFPERALPRFEKSFRRILAPPGFEVEQGSGCLTRNSRLKYW